MPETPMAGPLPANAMQGSPAGLEDQGGGMPTQQEVEAVKVSNVGCGGLIKEENLRLG